LTGNSHGSTRTGTPQRIALRRSVALRAATLGFALVATLSVYASAAPRCGFLQAIGLAAVTLVVLMLGMLAHERRQPISLKIGPDGIAALDRAGAILHAGRIVGQMQWPRLILILELAARDGKGRARPLLIPADSVSAESFRELAVKARHGAR
jgi:hypothetical protein